jgi:hypothetical protein
MAKPPVTLAIVNAITVNPIMVAAITLWIAGFLCMLNVALAIIFRKNRLFEVVSYWISCIVELAIFMFALLFYLGTISHIPYHLPPGLPVDRAQLGAALAIGIGLFPAAYWHRINVSELPKRIAKDAQVLKGQNAVQERKSTPGEWMN